MFMLAYLALPAWVWQNSFT